MIAALWRIESPKIIAVIARMTRDLALAEDCAQDAFAQALEKWPVEGKPQNPGGWLMTVARNRAIDRLRRVKRVEEKHALFVDEEAKELGDDMLRLIFISCHPTLSAEAQVALTLRLVAGLETAEIARAFLVPEPTIQQRIVRAKQALAGLPFEIPEDLDARLSSVLAVIYLVFNEGYSATSGDDWMRPALMAEGQRLARIVAERLPVAEAHGLAALLELQASRVPARTAADGSPVLLLDQNRARWDQLLIRRGLAALAKAEALGRGEYTLQAAIAACHARARRAEDTDWVKIAALYSALVQLRPSAVVELNRAVAIGMAFGPASALPLVDALVKDGTLAGYHLLPSVRADLLVKLGCTDDARVELKRALKLCSNDREQALLQARLAALE